MTLYQVFVLIGAGIFFYGIVRFLRWLLTGRFQGSPPAFGERMEALRTQQIDEWRKTEAGFKQEDHGGNR